MQIFFGTPGGYVFHEHEASGVLLNLVLAVTKQVGEEDNNRRAKIVQNILGTGVRDIQRISGEFDVIAPTFDVISVFQGTSSERSGFVVSNTLTEIYFASFALFHL